ncbi:acyltransferase family protein [soil metagenome]
MSQASKDRYAWVDFAKGICIVAVVTLYTTNYVNAELDRANWMNYWIAFAQPFRMPDFFLLSGLFLTRVIDRPWRTYLDNKVVHYAYFLILWTIIIIPTTWSSRGFDPTLIGGIKEIIYFTYDPWAMLWFIQMLALYFVVTRVTRRVPWWIMFPAAALLQIFPFDTGIKPLNAFGERYVFFYAGYLLSRHFFDFAAWVRTHVKESLGGLLAWALINGFVVFSGWSHLPGVLLVLGFAGACAIIAIAALIQDFKSVQWLRYLGQNSIVVYLGFYLPMHVFIAAFVAAGLDGDLGTMAVVVGILSILTAVLLDRVTRGTWLGFLFKRPKWAHLPASSAVRRDSERLAASSGDRV